jgi:uncharacterized protein YqhQ
MPIGGQALPNGVMMRTPYKTAIVLRHRSGELLKVSWPNKQGKIVKRVFFRGIYQLFVAMAASLRTAREALKLLRSAGKMRLSPKAVLSATAVIGLLILYAFASDWSYGQLRRLMPEYGQHYLITFLYGVVDIVIFSVTLFIITRLPVVRRMLRYHGAEHKAIACYEKGLEMTADNVRQQNRYHKRCGTSMVVTVALVAVVIPVFIPPTLTELWQGVILAACLLAAVGLLYESMRFKKTGILVRLGMAAQRITTREPDDDMIECAIAAVKEAVNIYDN